MDQELLKQEIEKDLKIRKKFYKALKSSKRNFSQADWLKELENLVSQNKRLITALEHIEEIIKEGFFHWAKKGLVSFAKRVQDFLQEEQGFLYEIEKRGDAFIPLGSIDWFLRKSRRLNKFLVSFSKELEAHRTYPLGIKILGIGEITTTIELTGGKGRGKKNPKTFAWIQMAIKRAPSFDSIEDAKSYLRLCVEYENFLEQELGIPIPYSEHKLIYSKEKEKYLVYNFQERLRTETIACLIIRVVGEDDLKAIFLRLLGELGKLFLHNRSHPEYQLGFDAQISNWSFPEYNPEKSSSVPVEKLYYLDTTTPLLRKNGVEQLNTELFMKSIPIFLRPIIRVTLLKEVLDRYYRPRDVILDLIASFITHQRPDIVPELVKLANRYIEQELKDFSIKPFSTKEIINYNQKDVLIWKFFRQMKRMDRFITERIFNKSYDQRLPRGNPANWENLVGAGGKGLTIPDSLRMKLEKEKQGGVR